jgi:hypothetical protein
MSELIYDDELAKEGFVKLYRIEAPHFTAGFITRYNIVEESAPILRWLVGSHLTWVKDCCRRKGWQLEGPLRWLADPENTILSV